MEDYLVQGVNAYYNGADREDNPYEEDSHEWEEWNEGWSQARAYDRTH